MSRACRTLLVADQPSNTDSFGPHARIAESIAQMIDTSETGHAVAITGPWGSGKSTVVQLLEHRFQTNALPRETILYKFDTWSHEGDPLRRAFLLGLIDCLHRAQWIDKEGATWTKEISGLNGRREVINVKSSPVITWQGKGIAILAVLAPLGYALVADKRWALGLSLSLLPLAGLLMAMIIAILRTTVEEHRWPWGVWSKISDRIDGSLFFVSGSRTVERSESIQTPDPTTIEFQRLFQKLTQEILGHEKKKLVIVIENLDRIAPAEAFHIWATMKAFFGEDAKHYWLLVPLQPEATKNIFDKYQPGGADAFVAKTFSTVFHVPEPVLYHWKPYLMGLCREAFPDHPHDDLEFDRLYEIFRSMQLETTPRAVKRFINEVGSLHSLWGDEIPLSVQATAVVLRGRGILTVEALLEWTQLESLDIGRLTGADLQDLRLQLAALLFGVRPTEARYVMLEKPLESSLLNGVVPTRFEEIAGFPGFTEIFEDVLRRNAPSWENDRPKSIAAAVQMASEAARLGLDMSNVWRQLLDSVQKVHHWGEIDESITDAIVKAVRVAEERMSADGVHRMITSVLRSVAQSSGTAEEWVIAAKFILSQLPPGSEEAVNDGLLIPEEEDRYLTIIARVGKESEPPAMVEYWRPSEGGAKTAESVVAELSEDALEGADDVLWAMSLVGANWPWERIFGTLKARLEAADGQVAANRIEEYIDALYYTLDDTSFPREVLKSLAESGALMRHLGALESHRIHVTHCVAPLLIWPSPAPTTASGQSGLQIYQQIVGGNRDDVSKDLAETLASYNLPTTEWIISEVQSGGSVVAQQIMLHLLERPDAHELIEPVMVYEILTAIRNLADGEAFAKIVTHYLSNGLLEAMQAAGFQASAIPAYEVALRGSQAKQVLPIIRSGLRAMSRSDWLQSLQQNDKVMALLLQSATCDPTIAADSELGNALVDYILDGSPKALDLSDLVSLQAGLGNEGCTELQLKLRDNVLLTEPTESKERLLTWFGNSIIEKGNLDQLATRLVRVAFENMLDRTSEVEFGWIRDALKHVPQVLNHCAASTRKAFIEHVQRVIDREESREQEEETTPLSMLHEIRELCRAKRRSGAS